MTNVLTWLIWAPALDAIFVLLLVCIFDALKAPCTHHHPLRIKALRDNGCTETRPGLQRFKSRRCPLGRHIAGSLSLAMDRWRQEVTEATKKAQEFFFGWDIPESCSGAFCAPNIAWSDRIRATGWKVIAEIIAGHVVAFASALDLFRMFNFITRWEDELDMLDGVSGICLSATSRSAEDKATTTILRAVMIY